MDDIGTDPIQGAAKSAGGQSGEKAMITCQISEKDMEVMVYTAANKAVTRDALAHAISGCAESKYIMTGFSRLRGNGKHDVSCAAIINRIDGNDLQELLPFLFNRVQAVAFQREMLSCLRHSDSGGNFLQAPSL